MTSAELSVTRTMETRARSVLLHVTHPRCTIGPINVGQYMFVYARRSHRTNVIPTDVWLSLVPMILSEEVL